MIAADLARAVLAADSLDDAKALARKALAEPARFAPFKSALHKLHVSEATLYRRVRAGAGERVNGRWIVDLQAAAAMGRRS